jgi:hypothetical protein
MHANQGCQIFLDKTYQNGEKYAKLPLNYRMDIKYANIFQSKALQNLPILAFLV